MSDNERPVTRRSLKMVLGLIAVWWATRLYASVRPTAIPYALRWILDLPHYLITRRRLLGALEPKSGERILELGPGTGYYTVALGEALEPDGALEILDVRPEFLDHTMRRVRAAGLTDVVATLGDGAAISYANGEFDAVILVSVLGEIPDPQNALREVRRVLRPGGRLVVGEMIVDPDFTRFGWVVEHAQAAGLVFQRRSGPLFGYLARLTRAVNDAPLG